MTHLQFLRMKKLTGKAIIEVAARHNHREILAELGAASGEHIDPTRLGLNRVLRGHGTAAAVASHANTLMDAAGIRAMRKDAVRALEIIFSLPSDSSIDRDRFFNESVQWAGQYFAVPVISAIVHNDEAAPHCHVLLLPLVDGRMVGSDLMGGRAKLLAMQADFHAQVGQRHGLARQTAQKRASAATRKQAIDRAFDVLEANSGLSADVLLALLAPHAADPAPLLLALGLTMPTPAAIKSDFVKMMTRPCKPEKPIGFGKKKPIGFDGSEAAENEQTLSCVGFEKMTPSFALSNEPASASNGAAMMSKGRLVEQADDERQTAPALAITNAASCNDFKRDQACRFSFTANACIGSACHARHRRRPSARAMIRGHSCAVLMMREAHHANRRNSVPARTVASTLVAQGTVGRRALSALTQFCRVTVSDIAHVGYAVFTRDFVAFVANGIC